MTVMALLGSSLTTVLTVFGGRPLAAYAAQQPELPKPMPANDKPIVAAKGAIGYVPGSWDVAPEGAFTYSIPLDVPQGRAGMQPSLVLTYSSGSGDGTLGMGWHVAGASSAITRCGRSLGVEGKISPVGFDAGDAFCLDGEKLIQLGAPPPGWPPFLQAEYRTRTDSFAQITSTVTQAGLLSGPDEFVVRTKSGLIRTYKPQTGTRVSSGVGWNPKPTTGDVMTSTSRVMWLLASEMDRSGNEIQYEYSASTGAQGNEYLPLRIRYTFHSVKGSPLAGQRYVEFGYETRPDKSFSYVAGVRFNLTQRLKAVSMYAPNPGVTSLAWKYQLDYTQDLAGHSLLASVRKCGVSGGCLRAKLFGWDPGGPESAVPTFTEADLGNMSPFNLGQSRSPMMHVLDLNGDGADDIVWTHGGTSDADSPDWAKLGRRDPATGAVQPLHDDVLLTANNSPAWPSNVDLEASRPLDLDADGTGSFSARYPDGSGKHDRVLNWSAAQGRFVESGSTLDTSAPTTLADMDGDGRMDYVTGVSIRLNTGGAFGVPMPTSLTLDDGNGGTCPAPRITDTNGDGRAELVGFEHLPGDPPGQCNTEYVQGLDVNDQPGAPQPGWSDVGGLGYYHALPMLHSYGQVIGDWNGDGLEDYLLLPTTVDMNGKIVGSPVLLWNTGAGLAAGGSPAISYDQHVDVRVSDVNSDGRSDLVTFGPGGTRVMVSLGNGAFAERQIAADGGAADVHNGRATSRVGDFNGDGRADVVRMVGTQMMLLTQNVSYPDRLLTVSDQDTAWARQTVTYGDAWSDHMEALGAQVCGYPLLCGRRGMPVVRRVVSRDYLTDPVNPADGYSLYYSYEDPVVDVRGSGFLGFARMRVWDPQRPAETVLDYPHRTKIDGKYYAYVDRPTTITTAVPLLPLQGVSRAPATANARVSKSTLTYLVRNLQPGNALPVYVAYPQTTSTRQWEQKVDLTWGSLVGKPVTEHVTGLAEPASPATRVDETFGFDDYGNRTQYTRAVTGGSTQTVKTDFDNRLADWLISLPVHEETTSSVPGNVPPQVTRTVDNGYDALGRLDTTWLEKNNPDPDVRQRVTSVIDAYGVTRSTTVSADGLPDRITHLEYTPMFAGQPNEEIYTSQLWYEHNVAAYQPSQWAMVQPAYGATVASMDANGVQATAVYDDLGRIVSRAHDGEAPVTYLYDNRNDAAGGTNGTITLARTGIAPQQPQDVVTHTDALGRTIYVSKTAFGGGVAVSTSTYDVLGRVAEQTAPAPGGTTSYTYDGLDRLLSTTLPGGAKATVNRTFFTANATDPNGSVSDTVYNVDGAVAKTIAHRGGTSVTANYQYAPFGLLYKAIDDKGHPTVYTYDVRGRRTQVDDPDRGKIADSYFGTGDPRLETHVSTGNVTKFEYDDLGRTTVKHSEDGDTAYTYDTAPHGIGKLASATSPDQIQVAYGYDASGRESTVDYKDLAKGTSYGIAKGYDSSGRPSTLAYPDVPGRSRFTTQIGYNSGGFASTVSDVSSGANLGLLTMVNSRQPNGAAISTSFPTSSGPMTETDTYDPVTGQLIGATTATANAKLSDLSYAYYPDGLVKTRKDLLNMRSEDYGYDGLGELTSWSLTYANQPTATTSYTYDTLSNLTDITRNGVPTEHRDYGNAAGGQPHTLTRTTPAGQSAALSTYDGQGRQTSGDGRDSVTFTAYDLPKSVTTSAGKTTYAYDAFGNKIKETGPAGETFYVPGYFEHRTTGNSNLDVFYLQGLDGPIGQVLYDGSTKLEYVLHDAIGSATATVDGGGTVMQRFWYEPFGGHTTVDGTPLSTVSSELAHQFTGQEAQDALHLIDMKGRLYDPAQHVFLTTDPLGSSGNNPYNYAYNSPLSFTDPTGYRPCGDGDLLGPDNYDPAECTRHGLAQGPENPDAWFTAPIIGDNSGSDADKLWSQANAADRAAALQAARSDAAGYQPASGPATPAPGGGTGTISSSDLAFYLAMAAIYGGQNGNPVMTDSTLADALSQLRELDPDIELASHSPVSPAYDQEKCLAQRRAEALKAVVVIALVIVSILQPELAPAALGAASVMIPLHEIDYCNSEILWHYTSQANKEAIERAGVINMGSGGSGPGVYVTNVEPGTITDPALLAQILWPGDTTKGPAFTEWAFGIETQGLPVTGIGLGGGHEYVIRAPVPFTHWVKVVPGP
ncbi:FG-GAP-like repeat-containing protein [Dactylosporangium sp. NPDC050588]|uniref:FG-GAP-like repeat-containing protein n=1 Tax=Dactylosporangium sp. NPDC050588 TaxID=3157211 RepID=UPI0033E5E761